MEEIKNFIYSHSSPNGCVALTRSERDELIKMVEKQTNMLNEAIDFIEQEDMQCKLCSFYLSCRDDDCAYKDETPISDIIREELEKCVEEHKNDNNCPDVMCDDCNKECELKKIMGETK